MINHFRFFKKERGKIMWKCPKCNREFKNNNQQHYCGKNQLQLMNIFLLVTRK